MSIMLKCDVCGAEMEWTRLSECADFFNQHRDCGKPALTGKVYVARDRDGNIIAWHEAQHSWHEANKPPLTIDLAEYVAEHAPNVVTYKALIDAGYSFGTKLPRHGPCWMEPIPNQRIVACDTHEAAHREASDHYLKSRAGEGSVQHGE